MIVEIFNCNFPHTYLPQAWHLPLMLTTSLLAIIPKECSFRLTRNEENH
jgi:hypothetical protein